MLRFTHTANGGTVYLFEEMYSTADSTKYAVFNSTTPVCSITISKIHTEVEAMDELILIFEEYLANK